MHVEEIKKFYSISDFVNTFEDWENFYVLDSSDDFFDVNPYSYVGIAPSFSIYSFGEKTYLKKDGRVTQLKIPLLDFMRQCLYERKRQKSIFPFSGGFIGYLCYDYGWFFDKFNPKKRQKKVLNLCLAKFNWYDEFFVIDNKSKNLFFLSIGKDNKAKKYLSMIKPRIVTITSLKTKLKSSISKKKYVECIEKTKQYIAKGDIYQANITQRFSCNFNFSTAEFYNKLRKISPAPFGAYLRERNATILCNSPERFLYKDGSYVETRPIKGTRRRSKNSVQDRNFIKELLSSEKDKAEHIMIVDLERNDLGKVCETGSVRVKELMRVESYANVHHLVSIVSGVLKENYDIFDCIKNTFPGGSITGAPKLRAMEIIEELEPVKRGVYCGSIGYIDASGNGDLNIAIRTGVVTGNRLYFNVGGGIVADSVAKEEYDETITKARSFLAAMGMGDVADE